MSSQDLEIDGIEHIILALTVAEKVYFFVATGLGLLAAAIVADLIAPLL